MYRLTSRLIIYRDIGEDSILHSLAEICRRFDKGDFDKEQLIGDIYEQIHCLLDVATRYGFNKNLWHNYLAYLIATTETPFTLVSEKASTRSRSMISIFSCSCSNMTSAGSRKRSGSTVSIRSSTIQPSASRSASLTGASARRSRS